MRWLLAALLSYGFLLGAILVFNVPLLVVARLTRKHLRPLVPRLTIAVGFALATAYILWTMDWFDVWRHGVPSVRYMLGVYAPYIMALGAIGWFTGARVAQK